MAKKVLTISRLGTKRKNLAGEMKRPDEVAGSIIEMKPRAILSNNILLFCVRKFEILVASGYRVTIRAVVRRNAALARSMLL